MRVFVLQSRWFGSFVSLHLRAGASPLEVAQWAGHSPAVMFKHYANVIEERLETHAPGEEPVSLPLSEELVFRSLTWARWRLGLP